MEKVFNAFIYLFIFVKKKKKKHQNNYYYSTISFKDLQLYFFHSRAQK